MSARGQRKRREDMDILPEMVKKNSASESPEHRVLLPRVSHRSVTVCLYENVTHKL